MIPEWMLNDFEQIYKHFPDKGLIAMDEDHIQTKEILYGEPNSFDLFSKNISE